MKIPRYFEKLSTGAGLLALGTGFVSLGAMSFINRHLEHAESGLLLNSVYPMVGSLLSILLGFAFLAIALLFMATRSKEKRVAWKVGKREIRNRIASVKAASRARGAGRAKLRLSRGFSGCPTCEVTPQK